MCFFRRTARKFLAPVLHVLAPDAQTFRGAFIVELRIWKKIFSFVYDWTVSLLSDGTIEYIYIYIVMKFNSAVHLYMYSMLYFACYFSIAYVPK